MSTMLILHIMYTTAEYGMMRQSATYVNFCIYDVDKTAQNDDKIKHIPSIPKVVLWCVNKEKIEQS